MTDWYTVRFTGRPPEGRVPKVPLNWKDDLELGAKLAELFGFEFLADLTMVKQPPHLIANRTTEWVIPAPAPWYRRLWKSWRNGW